MPQKISRIIIALAVLIAAIFLVRSAWDSLSWRYVHDSPLMVYAGYLISEGFVPYRDFFEMNVPGTYFVMWLMGSILGWGDTGFRVFDLLCMAAIAVMTFFWMRRFSYWSAVVAAIAFPLWYIGYGSGMSLQREYIALVPFAALLLVATIQAGLKPFLRFVLAGVLTGVAMLIKPQFILLALPVIFLMWRQTTDADNRRPLRYGLIGGILFPLVVAFLYLLISGGLKPFLDIAFNYWPLYTHMTRYHEPIGGWDRVVYIIMSSFYGLTSFYLPAAFFGLFVLGRVDDNKRYALMIGGVLIAAAIYPALAGQFFGYHWIPFSYVAICATSLAIGNLSGKEWSLKGAVPVVLILFMLLSLSSICYDRIRVSWEGYGGERVTKAGVPDTVNQFLRSNLRPGDFVQPLDWTGGAVHGMLMAKALPATRFIYDFHFYHHINDPYIRELRREFMTELRAAQPRFVIQVLDNTKPWPRGRNTTREFPELAIFLDQQYRVAYQGGSFRILERAESPAGG